MKRNVQIKGTGKYLPHKVVTSLELDKKLGKREGSTEAYSGIKQRYYAQEETASEMGARAIEAALEECGLSPKDIDCIVCASASFEQPIPATASLIQSKLGWEKYQIPCFDISCVCLSFLVAFDTMSAAIKSGRYDNVVIVTPEVISCAINWRQEDSCVLLGDAAAAVIIGVSSGGTSDVLVSSIKTYSQGVHYAEIPSGGSKRHPSFYCNDDPGDYCFSMDGRGIVKMILSHANGFLGSFLKEGEISLKDIDAFVLHPASRMSTKLMKARLPLNETNYLNTLELYGNVASAGMPLGLHEEIKSGIIKRGDKVLMLGGGGGFTLGAILFVY